MRMMDKRAKDHEIQVCNTETEKVQECSGQVGNRVILPDGSGVSIVKRVEVSLNPNRNYHNVSACRAPDGVSKASESSSLVHHNHQEITDAANRRDR